jgi:MFS superfamily sulfate permease-like transporter
MRQNKTNIAYIKGIIKDSFIGILLFALFSFIDLEFAFFGSFICFSILFTRRIIFDLNPGAVTGHKIYFKEKELSVPNGVDVFDAGDDSTFDNLYRYSEVIAQILIPPRILIIRFNNKSRINRLEIMTLNQILKRLEMHNILIMFSDVNVNLQNQFRKNSVAEKIGEENIFYYIKDALTHAGDILKCNHFA